MSKSKADLKRLKVTAETRAWLQAEATISGKSHQDIARAALHDIALKRIRAAKVLTALATAEGHEGDDGGRNT